MRRFLHNITIFSVFLIFLPSLGNAAQLTLESCLKQASERNLLLRSVRWEKSIAREQLNQTDSLMFPRVDLQGGYTMQAEAQAMKVNNQVLDMQQGSYAFANIAVNQTIYDFGRRDARRNQARSASEAAGFIIRDHEQDISLQVIEAFFGLLEAEKLVLAAEEEQRTVQEHRRVVQVLFETGVVTRNDLLQADVRQASARQKLLYQKNRNLNIRLQLNFLIGATVEEKDTLVEPPVSSLELVTKDFSTAETDNRPDLNAIRKQIEVNEQEVRESRTLFYPELFARFSMDYLQNDKVREQAIYAGTVGLKINLFDGFASTAIREKAVSVRSKNMEQLRFAEEKARIEILTARNDAKVAKERIAVTAEAINQGEENLRINQNRYQERVGTATEVLDAQTLLTQARTEHYRAYYDYQVASARVRRAVGKL